VISERFANFEKSSYMSFIKIEALLSKSLRKTGIKKQVDCAVAIERAAEGLSHILGEEVCEHIRPVYIRYRTLTIACLSDGAAAKMGRFEEDIIKYVNDGFPYPVIERIRVIC
jgi:Dna[CI] antecedent, DciA